MLSCTSPVAAIYDECSSMASKRGLLAAERRQTLTTGAGPWKLLVC
jgi:hypothetical protein